jgi:REP element-mobilizing transposase RayT/DNA-binding response OmpR family regulator
MVTPLLVFTQDDTFGKLVAHSLEGESRFRVRVSGEADEAAASVRREKCSLTLLDLDVEDALEVGRRLRRANPGMRFVFLSAVDADAALDELDPRAHLTKPFYVRDLLEVLDKLVPAFQAGSARRAPRPVPLSPQPVNPALPWLADADRAAQHLTRLTLESSAQAALINREGELWAYAGGLPQAAAQELGRMVTRYWDKNEESDLVRFVRLDSTNAEHMLFATRLSAGVVLALAFDAETPFGTIRSQAGQLARSLAAAPPVAEAVGAVEAPAEARAAGGGTLPGLAGPAQVTREAPIAEPPPKSRTGRQKAAGKTAELVPEEQAESGPRPSETGRSIVLEGVSASVYNLNYACLLIPRFAHHHLTGDLGERLSEWLPEICIAFGWRLEFIALRPDYLHWVANVPPAASPGYLMRVVRQQTSQRIFADFPRFARENPSGDFWTPGYLIVGGAQPVSAQMIRDFIQQTRQRQGVSNLLKPYYHEYPE